MAAAGAGVAGADASMREIAELSGGQFFTAATEGELRQVYAELGEQIGYAMGGGGRRPPGAEGGGGGAGRRGRPVADGGGAAADGRCGRRDRARPAPALTTAAGPRTRLP